MIAKNRTDFAWTGRDHPLRALNAIAMLAFFLLAGCAKTAPPQSGPDAAARTYLSALKAGDYETCYRMLAESDLAFGSIDGFLGEIPMAPNIQRRWFGQIEGATEYLLGDPLMRGGEAIVPVSVTTPNLLLWERMLGERDKTRQAVQIDAENQLAGGAYPRLSYSDQIVLVREGDEWHLLAGFGQRERVAQLHVQALSAYHQREFDEALYLYRQMLERLGKAPFSASGELIFRLGREMKRVQAARAGAAAAQAYLPRLMVKNVQARQAVSGSPGLFGQIVNAGDVALDELELTVSYYSAAGKMVHVEKHTPVALPLEFTDFDVPIAPLKPGETRQFGIALKASTEVQQQNKPQITVSGVIFSNPWAVPPKLAGSHAQPLRPVIAQVKPQPSPTATSSPAPSATPTPEPARKRRTRRHHRNESIAP